MSEPISESLGLPWKVHYVPSSYKRGEQDVECGLWDVTNDAGDPSEEYSVLEYTTEEQARFIVRSGNSFHDLLAACKLALQGGSAADWERAQEALKAAVAKAEGCADG